MTAAGFPDSFFHGNGCAPHGLRRFMATDRDRALAEKKKKKRREKILKARRKKVLFILAELAVCLTVCIGCYAASVLTSYEREDLDSSVYKASIDYKETRMETKVVEETDEEGNVIGTKTEEYYYEVPSSGYRNILLLGLDLRSQYSLDIGGAQSDVMMIASINNETGDVKLVSILRDTVMKMEEGSGAEYNKANSQYGNGGISKTVAMINRNLDLDIDDYVVVNWYAVAECVNQLGNIKMTLPDNQSVINAFNGYLTAVVQHTGLGATQIWEPGEYEMNGPQVVAFCRIRYGGLEDSGRAGNTREVISKMLDKAKLLAKEGRFDQLIGVAKTGLSNIKTNMKLVEDILPIIMSVSDYSITDNAQFPQEYITSEKGDGFLGSYYEKYRVLDAMAATDFAGEVKALHRFLFNDNSYVPSKYIEEISKQIKIDSAPVERESESPSASKETQASVSSKAAETEQTSTEVLEE